MSAKTVRASQPEEHKTTNPVLSRIVETGQTLLPSGEKVQATGYIDPLCGALLQKVIRATKPAVGVEVGLAFGISTLYILEAMKETGGRLIGMDPAQNDNHWRGGGMHNIRQSGYEKLYEFHENTSQQVLPSLVGEGQRVQFGFIDGWHTFDHVLIDFFYIDQMLDAGGVVVFDDVGYPGIKRACDFVLTNRDYEIYDCVRLAADSPWKRQGKQVLNRLLAPIVRTDRTPAHDAMIKSRQIDDVYFLALRKLSDDTRRFDHYEPF